MADHLKPAGQAKFKDQHVTKFDELLIEADGEYRRYGLVGAPLSKPSISHSGAAFAPGAIRQAMASYSTYSNGLGIDFNHEQVTDFGDINMHPTDIPGSQDRITESIKTILNRQEVDELFLLGGDHSVTYPSLKAYQQQVGTIGVIQFDAHHDLRNLQDGGPTNGTPFRRAIEDQVLSGDHLVQIGIRDFTNAAAYDQFAKEYGVTVFTMDDVKERGVEALVDQAIQHLINQVDLIYLSVDMDVLDQAYAPGCPAIGPGGMTSHDLLTGVERASNSDAVKAMDIVEIDPTLDFRNMTSRVAAHVLFSYWKGKIHP
ncbi:formimidoylglutamase [Alkalibacillus almallahensis]|uniref:formimidoylglutamase n=1 Tax=Alkalibacillus almallahensis TaxID=1379154 RepID=UPI0014214126|nr:formimidoylglutamase [Alkalibacillus almallahensis]NIK11920.1 formiminoglutamase [Alkalibacillus almallahensis]